MLNHDVTLTLALTKCVHLPYTVHSFLMTKCKIYGLLQLIIICTFYLTTLKGCRGIVFTHGVRMGGRREKVCLGCISETARCRKLILSGDIG